MKRFAAILILSGLLVMTACSSQTKEAATTTTSPAATATATTAASANPAATAAADKVYSLTNDGVDPAALTQALSQFPATVPTKIVTTSVPLAEMLNLLGITPVGVPTSTNPLPAAFDSVKRIGSPMQPDLEVVTSLQPDLLLGAESLKSTLDKNLSGIKLDKAYLRTDSFEDLKLSFKVLGTYFKKTEEMNKVLTKILEQENNLIKQNKGKKAPKVMLVIGTADSFMVMSEKSYLGSLAKKVDADNIATSALKVTATYSAINMEQIVAIDPDIVLVLASGDHGATVDKFKKEVEKNTTWKNLSAYKNDKIKILDYSIFGVTSITNVDKALTTISSYFYQ